MSKFTINKEELKILKGPFGQIYFGKIYRFMDMKGILSSLENSTLRYKSPRKFNDPLDCSSKLIDFSPFCDLIENNKSQFASEYLLLFLKKYAPKNGTSEVLEKLKELIEADAISQDSEAIQNRDQFIEAYKKLILQSSDHIVNNLGYNFNICCFSRNYDTSKSFLMWSHYADSHRGACLEFDMNKQLLDIDKNLGDFSNDEKNKIDIDFNRHAIPFIVKYVTKIPKIALKGSNSDYRWLTTKSSIWNYEKEVRCIIASDSEHEDIIFPYKYLTKIIFGYSTPEEEIVKVKDIINEKYYENNIRFEKMKIDPATFNLVAKEI